jgi:hypothetical protein
MLPAMVDLEPEQRSAGDVFWEILCSFDRALYIMLVLTVILLVMLLATFPFADQRGTSIIIVVDFAILLTMLAGMSFIFWYCNR